MVGGHETGSDSVEQRVGWGKHRGCLRSGNGGQHRVSGSQSGGRKEGGGGGLKRVKMRSQSGGRGLYGYSSNIPIFNGPNRCPHCFCSPCVMTLPPTFLVGSGPPSVYNAHKRYPLYRKFWRVLNELGLWRHEEYIARKVLQTSQDDAREIMPACVLTVRKHKSKQ